MSDDARLIAEITGQSGFLRRIRGDASEVLACLRSRYILFRYRGWPHPRYKYSRKSEREAKQWNHRILRRFYDCEPS